MTRSIKIILYLVFVPVFFFGQRKAKQITSTFYRFELAIVSDSTDREIRTDRIKFNNKNNLDTLESKLTLDSLIWFMAIHPHAIIEVSLEKDASPLNEYRYTELAGQQMQQIVDYLCKRGDYSRRLVAKIVSCGPLIVTDEDMKRIKSKKDTIIFTHFRVIYND
jgi:chemotaxis receptor (MCP) glutamine deamidase CheD